MEAASHVDNGLKASYADAKKEWLVVNVCTQNVKVYVEGLDDQNMLLGFSQKEGMRGVRMVPEPLEEAE